MKMKKMKKKKNYKIKLLIKGKILYNYSFIKLIKYS